MTSKIKKIQLKQVDDSSMTIHRKPYRNGYRFYDEANEQITDKSLLKRLKKLIIPPMWTDVRVCKWDDGHIQSIGRDLKGRKQYIYHSEWERRRQQEKFSKMVEFGEALPDMRKKVLRDINSGRWSRRKVLSMMVLILDDTGIRIGNHQYADRNGTYGLSTLRRKHLTVDDDVLTFEYKGKSNKMRLVKIEDENLIRLIKTSSELPGYEIFRYKTSSSSWSNVDSEDVNEYIRESMGENITSKDFRTWVASRVAVEYYPHAVETKSNEPRKKLSNILLRLVADELGNTPTVCKSYYVHPAIMQKTESGTLPISSGNKHNVFSTNLSDSEKIVLSIIG